MIDESDECGQLTMSPVSARGRRVTVLPSTSRFVPIEPSTNSLQQGRCYYQLSVFTKSQSHLNSQWVSLLATAFISVNAYFAQSISLEIRFASFSLCGAFHRVVQRRSEADSGAGSRKVVQRCRELEKCLLLRLPLARTLGAAAGGCIGKYVLSLVRPCCRASPLITAFSYPLAEGKRLQTTQNSKKHVELSKNCI